MARIELDAAERKEKWDEIKFQEVYDRLFTAKIVSNQTELATLLKLGRAAISYIAKKGYVPREWKTRFERAGISWDWAAYGDGSKYNANHLMASGAIMSLPRIIDIKEGIVEKSREVFEYPMHKTFLSHLRINHNNLGYFVQSGSAMCPSASENDVWIVDINNKCFDIGSTYVVKIGENSKPEVRIVLDFDGINNSVKLGHGNSSIVNTNVNINNVSVCGRCVIKVCRVL